VRLTRLKLSGFKSFVDPTTVLFPGQLAGVVGPNGCGKSNVIDAVRWVLGESKASELRGESIQDVIFKGSGTRKEVGRASVELFFDNTQGRAAGQWTQYAEITVRRVLDRQGNSNYYINNLHVRRRDVIDLFLGTGLGPRAYAIIGQGMISRIVEAKPDELRFFLEEAAGVTKYKERRRETENRLEDTREHIDRVNDIRHELAGQIEQLESQAEQARQYQAIQIALQSQQQLLWFKKRQDAQAQAQRYEREAGQESLRVDEDMARLRDVEMRVEHSRQEQLAASDQLHETSAQMHLASAEVRRLEGEIKHVADGRVRLEARLHQLDSEGAHWQGEIRRVEQEEQRWQALLDSSALRATQAQEQHETIAILLPQAEEAVGQAHQEMIDARHALHEAEQNLRLAQAEASHAQRALDNLTQRRARLEEERVALIPVDAQALDSAREALVCAQAAQESSQALLQAVQERAPDRENAVRAARQALQEVHRYCTEHRARAAALVHLQEQWATGEKMGQWLAAHHLQEAQPLWLSLTVDPGWETAVEAVLRERFTALKIAPEQLAAVCADPPAQTQVLALAGGSSAPLEDKPPAPGTLRAHVHCKDPGWAKALDLWLEGIYCCDDISRITPEAGKDASSPVWVNAQGFVRDDAGVLCYAADSPTHGVLERQREIDDLAAQLIRLEQEEEAARAVLEEAEQALMDGQEEFAQAQQLVSRTQQDRHEAQLAALKLEESHSRFEARCLNIDTDLADIAHSEIRERELTSQAELEGARCRAQQESAQERLVAAQQTQRSRDEALRDIRAKESQLARAAQDAGFSQRECQSKLEDNRRAFEMAQGQVHRVEMETRTLGEELCALSDAALQDQLQAALQVRQSHETELALRRDALENAVQHLRTLDEERLRIEHSLEPARQRINEIRLKQQAAMLNADQCAQRLHECGIDDVSKEEALASRTASLPKEMLKDAHLQGEIAKLNGQIEALGPVNLAAFDALEQAQQRKTYLDSQAEDLGQAIATLEDAIRRIDQETRMQLQETYDAVNGHFGTLFPLLFGGGEARLLLTGDEILDAGIQIMAQPPGKKNTTIHLLSGGEKALTAIALVFSLFQLNPAPFCMLDEVDAPLDDSNTVRFCELVKKMSVQTQFVFISHNKIAMEMAQQLIGVTMQERGVSRVVEVDIQEALRMSAEKVTL
jgi:chromosome segregation protein